MINQQIVEDISYIDVTIIVPHTDGYMNIVMEWCNLHFGKHNQELTWRYYSYRSLTTDKSGTATFKFLKKSDAVLFALRWS